jgi:hypothetical protein
MTAATICLQLESRYTRQGCIRLPVRCKPASILLAARDFFGHDRAVSGLTSAPWERLRRL